MKGAVFALFCAVALVQAEVNENGCPINPYLDVLKPHPNCNKYYQCTQGELFERKCASTLVFNVETQECDWPENVDCENRVPVGPDTSEEENQPDNGGGNNDPSLAPEICSAEGSDGVLVAHENCNQFYECNNGLPVAHRCASTLLFNPSLGLCDWPENVNCGDRNPDGGNVGGDGGNGDGGNGDGGNGDGGNGDGGNGDGGDGDGGNGDNGNGGNSDPGKAPEICAAEGSDGVLVAHENCNQFYKCSAGKPVVLNCWGNLLFNPANNQCDWPENINCADRNPDAGNGGNEDGGNGDGGNENGGNGDGSDGDSSNGGNSDPTQAAEICAAEGSDGVLVAHENCNQFYKCSEGKPVALDCPLNLLYNPSNQQCDWPENVNCGDRNPDAGNGDNEDGGNGDGGNGDGGNGDGGDGDSSDGGNSDPTQAAEICAAEGSDGILVAHKNCNQFYKCSEGKPVALECPLNLLYNPSNQQCDWPENVNCADRNPDAGNGGNEDGGNGDGGNGNGGNGHGSDGESSNDGNSDPIQAAEICAAEGSDGVLITHENCNQFYKCSEGKAVALDCPLNLLYNPSNQQCDWPENVNCADRNPDSGNGDNGDSGNGDGGSGDSGNGGNTDPGQAAEICAAEGSEDVLVAHENCNQFYICNGGKPVALSCWGDLQYNPYTQQCDWADNVDCGSRIRAFLSFNKHTRHARRM